LRLQRNPWVILALIASGTLICLYSIDRFQHRFVRSDEDLVRLLPSADATVFYAKIETLRHAGTLNLLNPAKAPQDAEYQSFVRATHFDYAKDLDAIAGSAKDDSVVLALKGRFDWLRIRSYVRQQGGACTGESCSFSNDKPRNYVSITRIQPDVMGIRLEKSKAVNAMLRSDREASTLPLPSEPVWIKLAPSLLKNPATLPLALKIFAISVQPADSVVIALGPPPPASPAAFEIRLVGQCRSAATADTIKSQLEIETKMLKLELAHERQQPNPADLTGLLTSGSFATNGNEINGKWLVRKELLKTLQQ
jgi:hypothetical protein